MTTKKKIILFQQYLRKPTLSLVEHLKSFDYIHQNPFSQKSFYQALPQDFSTEIKRSKNGLVNSIRRVLGILNFRFKFDNGDSLFLSYGCFLITNRPYCIYIENGLALFNFDYKLAMNPISKILFTFFVKNDHLKYLIFMSEAAKKSFFSTLSINKSIKSILDKKSIIVPPILTKNTIEPKIFSGKLKLLFVGLFYMKGGLQLINAFENLLKKYSNIHLTIVTPVNLINQSDLSRIKNNSNITLFDAVLQKEEMDSLYKNNDIFVLPTFRDSSPLVLLEAVTWGMPIIANDQYAVRDVAHHNFNAILFDNHPLKDYDPVTMRHLGKYRHPKDFYHDLFKAHQDGLLKCVEIFLEESIEKFLLNQKLLETFSKNSLYTYDTQFESTMLLNKAESIFQSAFEKRR